MISFVTPFSLATASVRRANKEKVVVGCPLVHREISQRLEGARAARVRRTARSQDGPRGVGGRGTLQSLAQVQLLDSPHWPWEPPTHHSHFASLPIALLHLILLSLRRCFMHESTSNSLFSTLRARLLLVHFPCHSNLHRALNAGQFRHRPLSMSSASALSSLLACTLAPKRAITSLIGVKALSLSSHHLRV